MPTDQAIADRPHRPFAAAFVLAIALAACGAAAAPSPSPPPPTPRPTPTAVPGDPGSGSGGGTLPGGGVVIPIPGDPHANPLLGNATYVTPVRGLLNLHAINVQLVRAIVDADRTATADLRWWSGVAPCNQLDSVEIERDEASMTIRLKVIEGSGGGQVACIDIAQLSATQVDLGKLASGPWTISADGDAPAIKLDVP